MDGPEDILPTYRAEAARRARAGANPVGTPGVGGLCGGARRAVAGARYRVRVRSATKVLARRKTCALLEANGFEIIWYRPEDAELRGHMVWLARFIGA